MFVETNYMENESFKISSPEIQQSWFLKFKDRLSKELENIKVWQL